MNPSRPDSSQIGFAYACIDAAISLDDALEQSVSGRELIDRGRLDDVRLASQLDASRNAAQLVENEFVSV